MPSDRFAKTSSSSNYLRCEVIQHCAGTFACPDPEVVTNVGKRNIAKYADFADGLAAPELIVQIGGNVTIYHGCYSTSSSGGVFIPLTH